MNTVDMEFQREFRQVLDSKTQSVEEVLSKSCEMLSELTNMATVVLGPKADEEHLVSVQLLQLSSSTAMGIFITDSGYVEKKTFVLPNTGLSFSACSSAVKLLDQRLSGTKISELQNKARLIAPVIAKNFGQSGEFLMKAFLEAIVGFAKKRFTVYGKKNLLSLPEFSEDSQAFMQAVDALEDPTALQRNLSHTDDLGSVKVGFTNGQHGDLAIVTKAINDRDQIAILGPKRMDYKKILSALEYVVFMLNRYFGQSSSDTALIPISEPEEVKPNKAHKAVKKGGKK